MKIKSLPIWIKVLGVISVIFLVILLIVTIDIVYGSLSGRYDGIAMILTFFTIPVFIGILVMWGLGFLTQYLIQKKKKATAGLISGVGLIASLSITISNIGISYTSEHPQNNLFLAIIMVIPLIYFAVSLWFVFKK